MAVSKIQQIRPHILKSSGQHRYAGGWLPDRPKLQDWRLEKRLGDTLKSATPVNPHLDRASYPSIRDQGELGSCTGHAARNALMVHLVKRKPELWQDKYDLSPMALYYYGREKIQMIGVDSGAYVRDVVDAARENGAPREDNCPYVISKFTKAPSATAKTAGKWHQAVHTYRCDVEGAPNETTIDNILHSLQSGMPVVFGFTCYDNLGEADANGVIPMPTARSQEEGGHCVCIYEADTNSRYFIGPNSWSEQWGGKVGDHRGYFLLPFKYFEQGLADDAWSVDLEA
jgi:C1A family cysteine protease